MACRVHTPTAASNHVSLFTLQAVIVNIIKVNAEWKAQGTREGSKENIREGEGEGWKKGVLVSSSFAPNTVNLSPL